jgi:fatty-acyl-CoA synthase
MTGVHRAAFPRLADPVRWWGQVSPSRVALVDRARDQRWTYGELDALADRWRDALLAHGVRRGDRVATLAGNRAAQPALLFACWRLGAALVPLNWRLAPPELARVLGNARPIVVVGEGRFRALAEGAHLALTGAHWVELGETDEGPPSCVAVVAAADVAPEPEDAALILYTSGSTGAPKGAVLPHRQLFYNAVATTLGWELGSDDVAPISTPFFHTGGWNVVATPLWQRGGRVVLFDQFDPATYLDGLAEEGCTVAFTVPTQLLMLLESATWGRPLPALRYIISGGAPCPVSLMARVRASGIGMKEGYGLTECGPNCFAMPLSQSARRDGSVGWPVPFLEARLVGEDGREVAPDEPGELLLRGPQCFAGYFDDVARTRETLDDDGWLHTGDLALRDADGAVRIRGRRKEIFISGGENVYPGEVEAALLEHPGIAEVAVVGVPDARWGEVGQAFVVARPHASLDPDAVRAWARERLAGYKVPRHLTPLPALPRLGSGKVDRAALLQLATAGR